MDYSEGIKKLMAAYLSIMKQAIDQKSYSDKSFKGQITSILGPTKFTVKYCGNTYTVSSSIVCHVGDMVRVCAPCNNWLDLYVVENKTTLKTSDESHDTISTGDILNWNDADSKKHTHSNIEPLKKITQDLINQWSIPVNDQTPTYTQADSLENLASGEKLSVSLGKIMKAITDLTIHKSDQVLHITMEERTKWNDLLEAAKDQVQLAKNEADRAEQYTTIVAPMFYIEVEEAALYMKPGVGVLFIATEDCEIYYKLT